MLRKRRKTMVDPDVKDWFLNNHECMKVKHKWYMMQSWRRARKGCCRACSKTSTKPAFTGVRTVSVRRRTKPAESGSSMLRIFKTWKSVLTDAVSESSVESVVTDHQDSIRRLSHALEEKKAWCGQKRPRSTFRTEPTSRSRRGNMSVGESDEDFARLMTQARVMHAAKQLFISPR